MAGGNCSSFQFTVMRRPLDFAGFRLPIGGANAKDEENHQAKLALSFPRHRGFEISHFPILDLRTGGTRNGLHQTIVADGFGRTTLPGFISQCDLLGRDWLTIDERESGLLVPSEEVRRCVATHVAVNAG